jgi:hypothetical protein
MNKIKIYTLVGLLGIYILASSFAIIGMAKDEFQQHEVEGKFGDSSIKLIWSSPYNLKGSLSSAKVKEAEHSWKFSEDFNSIEITTIFAGIRSSYTLELGEGNLYRGVAPSAFGMGQEIELHLYPDKMTGTISLDKIELKINPLLKEKEIPNLDWIFEQ